MTLLSLHYLFAASSLFFCVHRVCAQERQSLFIPLALHSISNEAGTLCLELYTGLQATSVRTRLFNLNFNRNNCGKNARTAGTPSMRVTWGQPEACGERSAFLQACVSRYRALWSYRSELWKTGRTSNN